jgi:3-methylcrotonyl-CoA carboxylase beta subunit
MDQLASRGQSLTAEEQAEFKRPTLQTYEQEGSPYFSTAHLWDDGILDPIDTRMAVGLGLDAACRAAIPETRFGVFRM